MLRELITWILNTYLGKYLEDFNPAQLSVALLSGEVELENVPIRKDALRSFEIPVQVLSGIIGKIKLQIPVRQFRSAPWCIVIEQVYAVFSPKNLEDWDDEYERMCEFDFKISELNSKEAIWRAQRGYQTDSCYYASSYSNWIHYGTSLATNIIENLELKLNNVHIRFEDSITIPDHHFVTGFQIDSLTVHSCDSSWEIGSKSQSKDIAYKLIELKNFAMYWDKLIAENTCGKLSSKDLLLNMDVVSKSSNYNYIINPISARAECKRERCKLPLQSKTRPRLSCNVILSELKIMLTDMQYQQIIGCSSALQNIRKLRSFKILRPTSSIIAGDARSWWLYAARCYGYKFETRIEKLQKLKDNLRYIKIYNRILLNPSENVSKEDRDFKTNMEKFRALEDLSALRNVCFNNVKTPGITFQSTKTIKGKSMLYHWFPNWWGWYGKSNSEVSQVQRQYVADEEKFQNIEDEILNALENSVGNNSFLKRDVVFGYFDLKLEDGKFSMCSENVKLKSCKIMMEINFQTLHLMIEARPRSGSHFIGLSMGSICVIDHITQGTEYPNLIQPQSILSKSNIYPSSKESKADLQVTEPWFQLQYEKRPIRCSSDFRLLIKSKSLDIVYNTTSYQWLINFITTPLKDEDIPQKKKNKNLILKSWKNMLVENMELRKSWSFEIDIATPQIIFVDNFTDKNSIIVLVDFGRFQLLKNSPDAKIKEQNHQSLKFEESCSNSDMLTDDEDMFMTPCSTPPGSENSPTELPNFSSETMNASNIIINNNDCLERAFHDKIYDKYFIDLTDLQVLICKNSERSYASLKGSSGFHLLDKFNISLELERRIIYTLDPDFPSLTIAGTLPKILVHINEHKISAVMDMLSLVSKSSKSDMRGSFSLYTNDNNGASSISEVSNNNFNTNDSNLIIIKFVVDQMTLEIQSQDRSIAELQVIGVRAGLTKKPEDTHISMSVHGLLFVDAIQSFGQDFELLVASHRNVGMDSISGSLKQSQPCSPVSPASPDPMVYKQPTSPQIIKDAINLIKTENHFATIHEQDNGALIIVELNLIKQTMETDVLRVANIHFNNLDIIANQETIAELIGFINRIVYVYRQKNGNIDKTNETEKNNEFNSYSQSIWHFKKQTEISFDFHRLNVLVLRESKIDNFVVGRKVGTFTMSAAKIHASLGEEICVSGSLGGLQILDVTPEGVNHQRILSVGKDPLTDSPDAIQDDLLNSLTRDVYGSSSSKLLNSTSQEALLFQIARSEEGVLNIKIRMASVWYNHCVRFITEINWCAFQFKNHLRNFARTIRNKATGMAIGFVHKIHDQTKHCDKKKLLPNEVVGNKNFKFKNSCHIGLDVILSSPVLILPRSSYSSAVLIANLGKISIYNAEEKSPNLNSKVFDNDDSCENFGHLSYNYVMDIKNINIFSLDTSNRKKGLTLPKAEEFYSCESDAVAILHDTALKLELCNYYNESDNTNEGNNSEILNIKGYVTQLLKVSLSRIQYEQLLDSLNYAFKGPSETTIQSCTLKTADEYTCDEVNAKQHTKELKQNHYPRNLFWKISFSLPVLVVALNNEHQNPLIELTFQKFVFNYNHLSNTETHLEVLLGSIIMEDLKCPVDSKHRHMVDSTPYKESRKSKIRVSTSCPSLTKASTSFLPATSMPDNLEYATGTVGNECIFKNGPNNSYDVLKNKNFVSGQETSRCDENLVTYLVQICSATEMTNSECATRAISTIDFNSLNLIISLERWFVVLDFFGLLSEDESNYRMEQMSKGQQITYISTENSLLNISVRSLNLILVRKDNELAKINISNALFTLKKTPEHKTIDGRLGSISLFDLTKFGKFYSEKFLTRGSEALNFHYKRHVAVEKYRPLEQDAVLKIQMCSVHYIHTNRFVFEIQSFIKEFIQFQEPVIKKIKLSESKAGSNHHPMKIGLDIKAESPIILLPLCYKSNDMIVADLGKFSLSNIFQFKPGNVGKSKANIIDVMHVDLININLFVGKRVVEENDLTSYNLKQSFNLGLFHIDRCGNNIFQEKCYLKLRIERNIEAFKTNDNHNIPDVSVEGTLSKVSCILSLQQYKVIRGFLSFNLGEDVDDVFQNYSHNLCKSFGKINSKPDINESKQNGPIWKVLSIKMELEDVAVHLNIQKIDSTEYISLACINFIKSFLEIDSYSDGSQDIDLISSEILITDSRNRSHLNADKHPNNVFFEIIKPINSVENIVQAEVHSRRSPEFNKYKILLNNMRIMAIIDWMECVKDFISENTEFKIKQKTSNTAKLYKTSSQNDEYFGDSSFEVIINITESELVFVEKTNQIDSSSIILKSTTIISYKPYEVLHPLSVDINHLEVFSCIIGLEHESALSIIDPVTLNIELQNNQLDVLLQKNFCVRLSYHDVKLLLKMLNSIKEQTRAAHDKQLKNKQLKMDFEIIAPLIAMGFKPKDCLYAMEISHNKLNEAALWLSQQRKNESNSKSLNILSVAVNAQFISFCVIDDCKDSDVPLLEISLSRLSLLHNLKENIDSRATYVPKLLSGKMEAFIAADYFNRRLSGWEPIIEPWECMASWLCKLDVNCNIIFFNFTIKSSQFLKLNITSTLIELYELVRNNWTQDYYEGILNVKTNTTLGTALNYKQRIPFVPFLLKNLTGEILSFKRISSQPGKLTRMEISQKDLINDWIQVKPYETIPFKCGPQNKLRHMNSHQLNLHQILVSIAGWDMIGPVSIDKVGVFFRYATEEKYVRRNRIVFDISLMGSAQKIITVRSALQVVNTLNISIELACGKLDHTYIVKSKESFCVPLNKIASQIFVKPYKPVVDEDKFDKRNDNQFQFCHPGISCLKGINDISEELCLCSGTNGVSFNILAVIKRDKYPNRELIHMPGHTIFFITPLKITNMLCCDLLFKISGHIAGRIHASETANIYNINIHESLHIRFTLDNYNVCGVLRIPSSHSGTVEPKLKLLDINNRELFLRASIQLSIGKGMEIYISAPVWLVNRTGLPLIYRQEGILHLASGQFEEHEKARNITPLMFSFTDPEAAPSLEIRLGKRFGDNNPWCKSFGLDKEIVYRELQEETTRGSYAVGIEIKRGSGRYSCTNIVTVAPRFELYNRSSHEIQFAQKCDVLSKDYTSFENKLLTAIPGCHFPFHWPNCDQEPILCIRLLDVKNCQWSSGIRINEVQSLYINVRNDSGAMFFLRLEVISHAASYFLLFGDAHSLPPPIRVDNYSDVQINFFQQGCKPQWRTSVRPQFSLAYVLDDSTGYQCLVIEAPGGNSIEFPLHKLEFCRSLTYSNFIYIAFKETFMQTSASQRNKHSSVEIENQHLVLGVKGKKVILMKKCAGDRSQLWLMNSNGQLEHEGSSPPITPGKATTSDESRLVLDLEKAPNPLDYTNLVIRPPNKQRQTTQTWRFDHGRLMCHANLCVQTRNGIFGLFEGAEAVLGRIESESRTINKNRIPVEQCIERQKLRPGSGHLQIISKMDGPILTIQIRDIKTKTMDECLSPDPLWKHTSTIVKRRSNESTEFQDFSIKFELIKGIGISVISQPLCEELIYITLQKIMFQYTLTSVAKSLDLRVQDIQVDNQLIDTPCPILLYTLKPTNDDVSALVLNAKMLQSLNQNAVIIENMVLCFKPYSVVLDERHLLKMAVFLGFGKEDNQLPKNIKSEYEAHYFEKQILSMNAKRYYFENLYIGPCQIRLSVFTATKLSPLLNETKKAIGLSLVKFEDALIVFDKFTERHHFETIDVYFSVIKRHYKNQIKWHAASILGSVDFLGNPLGLANDLSEGVSGLIFEGSVKSLVRNLTHGISNSTAKLTETLSDSLGRVVLDDSDTETRQKILEISSVQGTSTSHLAAGLKGFGFGLLGGVTSIVRQTYVGAQTDGFHGFISGLGKGLVGTVTKPLIGVLDLAAETATAVRETSRGSNRTLPSRKRWPRCVTGAPGGLLPLYSYRQSKGQQYLYMINRKDLTEHLISYEPNLCNDIDSKLRLLVSTEYIRIFSRCEEDPSIVLDCHLSEVLSCHPLTTGSYDGSTKVKPSYYIEISTNLPKITRPRIRCQNMEIAERASRYINYAKSIYDEREQTVSSE